LDRGVHGVERLLDRIEDRAVRLGPGQTLDRGQFQRRQHLVHVAQVVHRQGHDAHAVARNELDEILVFESYERFADGRPAHAELGGELLLEHLMPLRVFVVENPSADFLIRLFDQRDAPLTADGRGHNRRAWRKDARTFAPRYGRSPPVGRTTQHIA
jgi:hypothetical protein